MIVADDNDLRRRAQPLLDRPPYEALPVADLRSRAVARSRGARRRLAAALCVVVIAGGSGVVALTHSRSKNPKVALRTIGTAPPVTVPAGTTIADLQVTPIAGPDDGTLVGLYPVGDRFLATSGDTYVSGAWIGDASGHWRALPVPHDLRGAHMGTVEQVGHRVVVIATGKQGRPIVLAGPSLDRLQETRWTGDAGSLPAAIHPAPPPGHGITVTGVAEATEVGVGGVVMVGSVSAALNRDLLPKSVRDALAKRPGLVEIRDGRVIVTISGTSDPMFDQSARSLGLTPAEVDYLSPDAGHAQTAVWGAAWGDPLRQLRVTGIDVDAQVGNLGLTRVSDGFVLTGASAMWWSHDGRAWRPLAPTPGGATGLVQIGSRWVAASAGAFSDDEGRSWKAINLNGNLAAHSGTTVFQPGGASSFGLLGASVGLDAATLTTFAGRLLYSPDGAHWSSVDLDDTLSFKANIPSIAVGDHAAILESGLRAPGVQPQRFWTVAQRRPA